ncbi:MAG: hypothetical protein LKJ25_03135 [Clostridia bacterium]|nr:hypothetical protein [Clostridia bacterium]
MGIIKGTKLTDNPKNKTIKVRLDESTSNKLDYLSEKESMTKSDVVRKGIEIQYKKLNE